MTRRDYTIKWLFFSLATLVLVMLQHLILGHITLWGVHPFLLPMIAALATMWEGMEGLIFSVAFGLLTDLTTAAPFPCFYTLAFLVIALVTMLITKHRLVPGFICALISSVLSIILCDLLQMLFLSYTAGISFTAGLVLTAKELISVICMPLIYFPFRWLHSRVQAD